MLSFCTVYCVLCVASTGERAHRNMAHKQIFTMQSEFWQAFVQKNWIMTTHNKLPISKVQCYTLRSEPDTKTL